MASHAVQFSHLPFGPSFLQRMTGVGGAAMGQGSRRGARWAGAGPSWASRGRRSAEHGLLPLRGHTGSPGHIPSIQRASDPNPRQLLNSATGMV